VVLGKFPAVQKAEGGVTDDRLAGRLDVLRTPEGYRQYFQEMTLWRPFVEEVCRRHQLSLRSWHPGLPGTFPTFIVDELAVIKFFGQPFDGRRSWQVEHEAAGLMAGVPEIPTAHVLASGRLDHAPGWRYLVLDYLPGISLGEVTQEVCSPNKLALARWLGTVLKRMHQVKVSDKTALPRLTKRKLNSWAARRKREGWPGWPAHLAGEVDGYLATGGAAVNRLSLHFIHADMTSDHLLGEWEDHTWKAGGIIDFGDAMLGNIYYELAALHLDLFAGDRRLLAAFLNAYLLSDDDRQDFTHKAMSVALMHQFDVIAPLFARQPVLRRVRRLEDLAEQLWNVNDFMPGREISP
jgi:hygromycin-B 7''-O-kinase